MVNERRGAGSYRAACRPRGARIGGDRGLDLAPPPRSRYTVGWMSTGDDKVLSFEERKLDVAGSRRVVLVARPAVEIRLDLERLEGMRKGNFVSRVDLEILQAVADRPSALALVIFDARGTDGQPLWGFDPELEDEHRMELGRSLLRSQLTLYRQLVSKNVAGLVGVGFGSFALAAFQRGTVRIVTELSAELETATPEQAAEIAIDLWLIEHAATWTGLPLDEYLATKLADELLGRERKRPEIEKLLAAAR